MQADREHSVTLAPSNHPCSLPVPPPLREAQALTEAQDCSLIPSLPMARSLSLTECRGYGSPHLNPYSTVALGAGAQMEAGGLSLSYQSVRWVGSLPTVPTNEHMAICCLQFVSPHTSLRYFLPWLKLVRWGGKEHLQACIGEQGAGFPSSCLPAFSFSPQVTLPTSILPPQFLQTPSPFPSQREF